MNKKISPIMEMVHETATGLHTAGIIDDSKMQEFTNTTGYPYPRVGVSICVMHDNKILLGKRKGSHAAGVWSTPGGHLEYGETLEQCAEREVLEETGIKIKNILRGPYLEDVFEEEHKHYLTLYLFAQWESGEVQIKEPDKCEGWEWFDWNNLPEPLFPSTAELVRQGYQLPEEYLKKTKELFVIHSGYVDTADGRVYINCDTLMRLYGLTRDRCIFALVESALSGRNGWKAPDNAVHLYPRSDGNYVLPSKEKQ